MCNWNSVKFEASLKHIINFVEVLILNASQFDNNMGYYRYAKQIESKLTVIH